MAPLGPQAALNLGGLIFNPGVVWQCATHVEPGGAAGACVPRLCAGAVLRGVGGIAATALTLQQVAEMSKSRPITRATPPSSLESLSA